jgi:hypothetical protein
MRLTQIKFAMRRLSLNKLKSLNEWLQELIRETEHAKQQEKSSLHKQTVSEQPIDSKAYRLEKIRCGKENCKCTRGKLHGPYWYSYIRNKEKVTSQYIGKKLPKVIEKKMSPNSRTTRTRK